MQIDPRAWTAVTLAVLALWLATPREDDLLIPQRRRSPMAWLRDRLARSARDRQEERDAAAFLTALADADPPVYRIRQRDLPSVSRRIDTVLLADVKQPWAPAPYAPDPEDGSQEWPQDPPQENPQEPVQEEPQDPPVPLAELRAWSPGDPGPTPTGVLQKITPEVERQLRPYLDALPGYDDEPGQ
jgi:hypothetical protein